MYTLPHSGSDSRKRYKVSLTLTGTFDLPNNPEAWKRAAEQALTALDAVTLHCSKKFIVDDNPDLLSIGNSTYRTNADNFRLNAAYVAIRGYYSSLKSCMGGLAMVSDMSVSCFLEGGEMVQMMMTLGEFRYAYVYLCMYACAYVYVCMCICIIHLVLCMCVCMYTFHTWCVNKCANT